MRIKADLHLHSVYSDGLYSPDEICRMAKRAELSLIAITDHDTLNGETVKREAAKRHGLRYLSGWEVSAYTGGNQIHVLGYGCQQGEAYRTFMQKRWEASLLRAKDSVAKFCSIGVPLTIERVLSKQADRTAPLHTMHIARAAAELLGMNEGEVYRNYLSRGKAANSGIGRPTPQEAIDCIHASDGFAVIAHPGRIRLPQSETMRILNELADYGVDGIETYYTTHTEEETEQFRAFAKRRGLFVTGGSDTHYEEGKHTIGVPQYYMDENFFALLDKKGKIL
ncbi:MAG: PHP domain-containing protein [Clostridia bacterium]|nr:PHP domain-containing protein [Clostridia bacterium]